MTTNDTLKEALAKAARKPHRYEIVCDPLSGAWNVFDNGAAGYLPFQPKSHTARFDICASLNAEHRIKLILEALAENISEEMIETALKSVSGQVDPSPKYLMRAALAAAIRKAMG